VTGDEARRRIVAHLVSTAEEALESARSEAAAARHRFAMNRVYYACFYAASALFLAEGRQFVKHAGLRAAVHEDLVKPGLLSTDLGKFFDKAFTARQSADYGDFVNFDAETVRSNIRMAERFVLEMKRLLSSKGFEAGSGSGA
jgi:uncharacterized protein